MKRRLFLLALLACASLAGATASAQTQQPQEVPPDRVSLEEFTRLRAAGKIFVLDVRYQIDRKIKGATHIPLGDLEARLADLPRDREIITYCS
jgi:hypothetical protein